MPQTTDVKSNAPLHTLRGKRILLGVTGGIAAYKTAFLIRLFIKAGAEAQVVLTKAAADFVSPLTLAALSKNTVHTSFVNKNNAGVGWNNHVELGGWADVMVVAPATANTMAKMAVGMCDNFLMAAYLSAKCPVFFAPAMDLDMYRHPAIVHAMKKLQSFGNIMIPAETGELAGGLYGEGRMAEPEEIARRVANIFAARRTLEGKRVLVTAGPTYEAIDPVRFIGNHSSGLMGYELARAAADRGADVVLISGPSALSVEHAAVSVRRVVSAQEMHDAVLAEFEKTDIVIAAAAVSDYRPVEVFAHKIKKSDESLSIKLEKTPDILRILGRTNLGQRTHKKFLVGFALETENGLENAKEKLRAKNLDAVVLNSLEDEGAGFGHTTNKVTFLDSQCNARSFELKSKAAAADDILSEIAQTVD